MRSMIVLRRARVNGYGLRFRRPPRPRHRRAYGLASHILDRVNGAGSIPSAPFTLAATDGSGESIRESMGGGSWVSALALLNVHTPSKNPHPVSGTQAYIAWLPKSPNGKVNERIRTAP